MLGIKFFDIKLFFIASLIIGFLTSCASKELVRARQNFYNNNLNQAIQELAEDKYSKFSKDKLLFLMEKGLILHHAGLYQESIKYFLKASKLIEEQSIISVSQQASSLIINDKISDYKGEYSEHLWVHTYLIMNYLLINNYEDALVEAKQAIKLIEKYPFLSNDYFTQSLIALCFENLSEFNGAYIIYKSLFKNIKAGQDLQISQIVYKLYGLALKLGFYDDAEKYKNLIKQKENNKINKKVDLILFVSFGKSPIKASGSVLVGPTNRFSFPIYKNLNRANLQENSQIIIYDSNNLKQLEPVFYINSDLSKISKESLDNRAKEVFFKETARVATKEILAKSIEDKNSILGALFRIFFFLTEEADTRCWEGLPGFFQLIKISLEPGKYNLIIKNFESQKEIKIDNLKINPNQKPIYKTIRFI